MQEEAGVLSTVPAGVFFSIVMFVLLAPVAKTALPRVPAFVPLY